MQPRAGPSPCPHTSCPSQVHVSSRLLALARAVCLSTKGHLPMPPHLFPPCLAGMLVHVPVPRLLVASISLSHAICLHTHRALSTRHTPCLHPGILHRGPHFEPAPLSIPVVSNHRHVSASHHPHPSPCRVLGCILAVMPPHHAASCPHPSHHHHATLMPALYSMSALCLMLASYSTCCPT